MVSNHFRWLTAELNRGILGVTREKKKRVPQNADRSDRRLFRNALQMESGGEHGHGSVSLLCFSGPRAEEKRKKKSSGKFGNIRITASI